jgi:hypothetical protein
MHEDFDRSDEDITFEFEFQSTIIRMFQKEVIKIREVLIV